ncbi:MAG: universal stress protein [Bacteroidia bacterium]|jgi:nucleotide-binding universal stress UspA family protein
MKSLEETKTILVPVDFSSVTRNSMNYASALALVLKKNITLLHVVHRGFLETEHTFKLHMEEVTAKLENLAEDLFEQTGIETNVLIKRGSVFETIGEWAQKLQAAVVVIATHGVRGLQHIFGSHTFKMISSGGEIPFMVVQERPMADHGFKRIVLPFTYEPESRQKLTWAAEWSKLYQCKFYLLAERESDEYTAQKVEINMQYAERYLKKRGVDFELHTAAGRKPFFKEIIRFSISINADLIMLVSQEEFTLSEFFIGPDEQDVIANEAQIPVFCINAFESSKITGQAMFR